MSSMILYCSTVLYEVFVLMSIIHREGVACGQQCFMKSLFRHQSVIGKV